MLIRPALLMRLLLPPPVAPLNEMLSRRLITPPVRLLIVPPEKLAPFRLITPALLTMRERVRGPTLDASSSAPESTSTEPNPLSVPEFQLKRVLMLTASSLLISPPSIWYLPALIVTPPS